MIDRRPRSGFAPNSLWLEPLVTYDPAQDQWTIANWQISHPTYVGWPEGIEPVIWEVEDLADMVATMKMFEVLANGC